MWLCLQISEESNRPKGVRRIKLPDVPNKTLGGKGKNRRGFPKSGHAAEDVRTRNEHLESGSQDLVRSPRSISVSGSRSKIRRTSSLDTDAPE